MSPVSVLTLPFLLYLAGFHAVSSKGVRVPLAIVGTAKGKERQVSRDAGVTNYLAISGTGFFGWETLQLNVALGTPRKC